MIFSRKLSGKIGNGGKANGKFRFRDYPLDSCNVLDKGPTQHK